MTCIAGGVDLGGIVHIAADRCASNDYMYTIRTDRKIFESGGMIFGNTGSPRFEQILKYHVGVPPLPEAFGDADVVHKYLVTELVPAIREAMKTHGFGKHTEGESNEGGKILIGCRGVLAVMYTDYQIGINSSTWEAIGSGEDVAYGSMLCSERHQVGVKDAVRYAVRDAACRSVGVAGEPIVASLQPDNTVEWS